MKLTTLKILWLIAFLLIQYKSIGQKDTTIVIKPNDSVVSVPKNVAIWVTKDLLKKDILEKQVTYLKIDSAYQSNLIELYKKDSSTFYIKEKAYIDAIGMYKKSLLNCEDYARRKDKQVAIHKFRSTVSQGFLLILSIFVITKL